MESVWKKDVSFPSFPTLQSDKKTDVLIIGGGIAGILTAYFLKQRGIDCMLLEKDRLCSVTTCNTTAKITAQHGFIYDKIMRKYGIENAKKYLQANTKALEMYRQMSLAIDCDFETKDNVVYTCNNRQKAEKEMRALEAIGADVVFFEQANIPIRTDGAVCLKNQAQFHPLKFLSAICKDLPVYEHSFVREMIGNTAVTDNGRVQASHVIIATHFPFINKHGLFPLKLYQHRSYVIALENARHTDAMYVDEADKGFSFRTYKDLLLLGGGDHRTGKNGGAWQELRDFAAANYPQATEKFCWATQDCMSLDGLPYIGKYGKTTHNLYTATGFNKWGMTSAMLAAHLLCDAVQEKENDFSSLFSPSRSMLHGQLLINTAETFADYLLPTTRRCPHLGCALRWNRYEYSWDCPCHGSRFDKNGKLLDNPANGNLK